MQCYGAAVPTTSNTTSMSLIWSDNGNSVQASNTIPLLTSLTAGPTYTATISISYKRFKTAGFKSLYSFAVSTNYALDQNSRLYFDFHMNFNSKLDS